MSSNHLSIFQRAALATFLDPLYIVLQSLVPFPAAILTFSHKTVFKSRGTRIQQTSLGQFPTLVLTLNSPALPTSVTSPGAAHPNSRHPLGSSQRCGQKGSCRCRRNQDSGGGGGCSGATAGGSRCDDCRAPYVGQI